MQTQERQRDVSIRSRPPSDASEPAVSRARTEASPGSDAAKGSNQTYSPAIRVPLAERQQAQLPCRQQPRSPHSTDAAGCAQSQRSDDSFSAYLHQTQSSSPASSQHKELRTDSRELSSPLLGMAPPLQEAATVLQTPVRPGMQRNQDARSEMVGPGQHQLHTPSLSMADPWRGEADINHASRPLVSYDHDVVQQPGDDVDTPPAGWSAVLAAGRNKEGREDEPMAMNANDQQLRSASPQAQSEHEESWDEVKDDEDELVDDDDQSHDALEGDRSMSFAGDSFDAEDGTTEGTKKRRRRMNKQETTQLASVFAQTQFPDAETRQQLATKLNMSVRSVSIWFQNKRQAVKKRASRFGGVEGVKGATVVAKRYESEEPEGEVDGTSALFRRWPSLDDFASKPAPVSNGREESSQSPCASPRREAVSRSLPLLDAFQARTGHKLSRIASMPAMAKLVSSYAGVDDNSSSSLQNHGREAGKPNPERDLRNIVFSDGLSVARVSGPQPQTINARTRPGLHRSASVSVLRSVADASEELKSDAGWNQMLRQPYGRPRTNSEVALRTRTDGQATLLIDDDAAAPVAKAQEEFTVDAKSAIDKRLAKLRMPPSLAEALRRHGLISISLCDKGDKEQAKRQERAMWRRMESSSHSSMPSDGDADAGPDKVADGAERDRGHGDEEDEETTLRIIANRRAAKLKAKMEQHQGNKEGWITDARVALGLAKPCRQEQRSTVRQRPRKLTLPFVGKSASQVQMQRGADKPALIQSSQLPTLDMAASRDRSLARSPSWGSVVGNRLNARRVEPLKPNDRSSKKVGNTHARSISSPQHRPSRKAAHEENPQLDASHTLLYEAPDVRNHALGPPLTGNNLTRSTSLSRVNEQQALRMAKSFTRSHTSANATLYHPQQTKAGVLGANRPSPFLHPSRSEMFQTTPPLSMRYSHSRSDAGTPAASSPLGSSRSQNSVFGVLRNSYATSHPSRFGPSPTRTSASVSRYSMADETEDAENIENIPSLHSSQRSDGSDDWTDRWTAERSPEKPAPSTFSARSSQLVPDADQAITARLTQGKHHDDSGFFGSDDEEEGENAQRSFNSKKRLSSPSSTASSPQFASSSSPGKKRRSMAYSCERRAFGSASSRVNSINSTASSSSPSKSAATSRNLSSDRDRLAAEMLLDLGSQSQS